MRKLLLIIILFLAGVRAFAYNPFWIHKDKKLIFAIINLDKSNPKEIEAYFKNQRIQKSDTTKEILGFGWSMWEPGIGSGYISVSAKFFYYHDSIVSYSITPKLPDEIVLQKRYKKWYGNYFKYTQAGIQPININEVAILHPLKEYTGTEKNIKPDLINYMTPNSGTMYGYSGGGVIMHNRKAYLRIKNDLTSEQVVLLMYSLNPASRLTAIEFYLDHKEMFLEQQAIDNWIEIVFSEKREIKTMSGCFEVAKTPETLFRKFYVDKYYH